jgi:hypothetical protein
MRDLNIGNQCCGGGGYRGKKDVWAKENAEDARLWKENPWHKFTDEQVMQFVRAATISTPNSRNSLPTTMM